MRKYLILSLLVSLLASVITAQSSDEKTEFHGVHFSLEGALELFKNSENIENFELLLNSEDNYVNNLDLNEDGEIDYIRVEDRMEDNLHAIVLQVPVSEEEYQDVAVIEIEKTGENTAMLQIIGDEEIYGKPTIIEPYDVEASSDGKGGPSADYKIARVIVNVYFWSPVRFIYRPNYHPWVSPYRWRKYPRSWNPWRPRPLNTVKKNRLVYNRGYRVANTHRVVSAHRIYTPHRRSSVTVKKRTTTVRVSRKNGKVVKKTTSKTVKKRNGKVVNKRKTVRRKKKRGN